MLVSWICTSKGIPFENPYETGRMEKGLMCLQISKAFNQLELSALGRIASVEMKMERIFTQKRMVIELPWAPHIMLNLDYLWSSGKFMEVTEIIKLAMPHCILLYSNW